MKESVWGYWIILLGLFVIVIMMLLTNYTTTNEQDYYLIKEVTESAMADSMDLAHFRKYGEVRIIKEKFVEDWIRRFSESVNINKSYNIKFYDIYEAPPKVSVQVSTKTDSISINGDSTDLDVVNRVDAILEVANNYKLTKPTTTTTTTKTKEEEKKTPSNFSFTSSDGKMKLNSSDGLKTGTITTIVYSNYYTDLTDKNATVRHVLYKPSQDVIANILSAYNEEEDNLKTLGKDIFDVNNYTIKFESVNFEGNLSTDADLSYYSNLYNYYFKSNSNSIKCKYPEVNHEQLGVLGKVDIKKTGEAADSINIEYSAPIASTCAKPYSHDEKKECEAYPENDNSNPREKYCQYGIKYKVVWSFQKK